MNIPEHLIEVYKPEIKGFSTLIDNDGWRIAALNCFDKTRINDTYRVERHKETNEVFILTSGKAFLVVFDASGNFKNPFYTDMEDGVVYNIPQNTWHFIIMSETANVILFERSNTSTNNSDYYILDNVLSASITQHVFERLSK